MAPLHDQDTAPLFERLRSAETSGVSPPLRTVGLFSGVGGLELGLSRAEHKTTLLCEVDPVAQAVLSARFRDIPQHDDVTTLAALPEGTQLVAAGFPCQDLSQAGRTAGIFGARSGLVAEIFRLLRDRPVPWVLLENVPFLLHISKGKALAHVLDSLEGLGYNWAYRVIDSRAFGLPQRRERVFIVASRGGDPRACLLSEDTGEPPPPAGGPFAYGFYWTEGNKGLGWAVDAVPALKRGSALGIASPPGILLPDGRIVVPDIRDAESLQGFPRAWTAPASNVPIGRRTKRWGLVGNAVTVDVAEWLGWQLRKPRPYHGWNDRVLQEGETWPRAAWCMGGRRYASAASAWPVARRGRPLHEFLQYPGEPLSERATSGFLSRVRASTMRLPPGFVDAVAAHLATVRRHSVHP